MRADPVTLFLCGDVMLGRGVDQILPHPGDRALREPCVQDALDYVTLAEAAHGPIPRPAGFFWPWGDALRTLEEAAPDVRVVNLETSVTRSDEFAPRKAVHYRMNPANLPCLAAARPDACVLANNHVLDFGRRGLAETLDALAGAGLRAVGAGRQLSEARRPAVVTVDGGGRVLVFSWGMASSGVPPSWAATPERAGVDFLPEPPETGTTEVAERVRQVKRPGDVAVASIHWGSNWGYDVSRSQTRLAHGLVDGGVDVVHGHSSHHPRPIEVYRDRLILYGCGDLVDDYEGITGYEEYRDDLRLMYFVSLEPGSGKLAGLRMTPMRARRLRLQHASREESEWLQAVLDRVSRDFGSRVDLEPDGTLALRRA
ncbi:CapA family protein [Sphaerisporangium sp. NPDC088356]|uniref:CapA family protein n=1 Tax=Sphaerisporangium sp. NPDC088356 TaxID=3154871 RepID=UPI0034160013